MTVVDQKALNDDANTEYIDTLSKIYHNRQTLEKILQLHSHVFVRNYGPGSLSTISIRGSSAAQTQVLWQGIPINHAMTGISDFSQIPVSFFDQIRIEYGSDGQTQSVAGGIVLKNDAPSFQKITAAQCAAGYESIGNLGAVLRLSLGTQRWLNQTRIFLHNGQNRYSFYNPEEDTVQTLLHAGSKQYGLLNDLYFKPFTHHTVSLHVWLQKLNREIPPAIFEAQSKKSENQEAVRALLNWSYSPHRNYEARLTTGMIYEQYQYIDSLIPLNYNAQVLNMPADLTIRYKPRYNHQAQLRLTASHARLTDRTNAGLNKAGVSLSYGIDPILRRISLHGLIRKEFSDRFSIPLMTSLTVKLRLLKYFKAYAGISGNYRIPTLNELYYEPGGNLNLKPEQSKNLEGGMSVNINRPKFQLQSSMDIYHRKVNNWIAWYGNAILTPHNIQEVWSRGIEASFQYSLRLSPPEKQVPHEEYIDVQVVQSQPVKSRKYFHLGMHYAYTLSTTEKSAIPNDYSIGKQIPYVPRYQLKGNIGLSINRIDISFVQTYTGYRFITTDESRFLLPYSTSNILTSYMVPFKHHKISVTMEISNLLNQRYMSIAGRIMPGRVVQAGFRYYWN